MGELGRSKGQRLCPNDKHHFIRASAEGASYSNKWEGGGWVDPSFSCNWMYYSNKQDRLILNINVLSPRKGSNWISFHFIGIDNGTGGFKNTYEDRPFWNPENVLSPEGSLRKQTPRGPFLFTYFLCGIGRLFDDPKIQFMFYFTGGWGWWTGYQKCPSIFFILCWYMDHVYVLLINIVKSCH